MPVRCSWKPRRIGSEDWAWTKPGQLAAAAPAAMPFRSARRFGAPIMPVICDPSAADPAAGPAAAGFRRSMWGAGRLVHGISAGSRAQAARMVCRLRGGHRRRGDLPSCHRWRPPYIDPLRTRV